MYLIKLFTDRGRDPIIFKVSRWDDKVKNALGIITLYGEDEIELVIKGELIEPKLKVCNLKDSLQEFIDENYKDTYFWDFDSDYIDECMNIIREVALV